MAKRLSIDDKKNIVDSFTNGATLNELSRNFSCTKLTIIRNLKQSIGENLYKELSEKNKNSNQKDSIQNSRVDSLSQEINLKSTNEEILDISNGNENILQAEFSPNESFFEIAPLNYDIENSSRKELSSVSISEIDFPKIVYMIVNKNIELEIKLLKDYPQWDFLPISDLNRKTIEIYNDIKVAKRFCNKEQKVIKVPNTEVFRIVAPTLVARGISRIICSEQLIAL
ncbi:hypothetical protein [uncultured Prochlorococcus sp.]|uniref:hypothetical protein n=1 Tax=uncultured Prochlorococcus sp. TaxID=159733 RepID=UPI002586DD26|nr:hypothetical protein [uncultured Prochlorococcus sp.]